MNISSVARHLFSKYLLSCLFRSVKLYLEAQRVREKLRMRSRRRTGVRQSSSRSKKAKRGVLIFQNSTLKRFVIVLTYLLKQVFAFWFSPVCEVRIGEKMKTGLVSISFRKESIKNLIKASKECGID